MAKLGETKPINEIVIKTGGDEYVFTGGGGQPGPDSVGHEELKDDSVDTNNIVDGSVQMQDLNNEVKDKMTHSYDAEEEGIRLGGIIEGASYDVNGDDGNDDI